LEKKPGKKYPWLIGRKVGGKKSFELAATRIRPHFLKRGKKRKISQYQESLPE